MKNFALASIVLLSSQSVCADVLGVANGRSATIDDLKDLSVDFGYSTEGDVSNLGVRLNYKVSSDLMLFGDIGNTSYDLGLLNSDASGISFGFGGYYQLKEQQIVKNSDLTLKASYHLGSIDLDGCSECGELDLSELAFEALISGEELGTTGLAWYFNAGIHVLGVEVSNFFDDSSNEISFGGGVIGDVSVGQWFAGVDFIDELFIRGGFRYNIQ